LTISISWKKIDSIRYPCENVSRLRTQCIIEEDINLQLESGIQQQNVPRN